MRRRVGGLAATVTVLLLVLVAGCSNVGARPVDEVATSLAAGSRYSPDQLRVALTHAFPGASTLAPDVARAVEGRLSRQIIEQSNEPRVRTACAFLLDKATTVQLNQTPGAKPTAAEFTKARTNREPVEIYCSIAEALA